MDYELTDAVTIVARQVIINACDATPILWENYPEISEADWALVTHRVDDLVIYGAPGVARFREAYALLEAHADWPENRTQA